jgi:hypothetical protein
MIVFPIAFNKTSGYSAEYQAVYDTFTTPPSDAVAGYQDTMVKALVGGNVWAKGDVFYVLAQSTNDNDEALPNWIDPGTYDATLIGGLPPTFTALEGITCVPANTACVATNFNPSTATTPNYVLDSACVAWYCRSATDGNFVDFGGEETNDTWIWTDNANAMNWRVNTNVTEFDTNADDSSGFWIMQRTASNASAVYRNDVSMGTSTNASTAVTNREYTIGARMVATQSNVTDRQYSIGFIGASLSSTERTTFYNAVQAYMTSINKEV